MLDSFFIRGAVVPLKIPTVDAPASAGKAAARHLAPLPVCQATSWELDPTILS